uniref:Tautomerase family protein n=1 Tax=Heterorhabditis bacteriophora TaxID=37862 RepID=A0A1I7XHL9_HETBA
MSELTFLLYMALKNMSLQISLESLKKNKDLHQFFVRMWDVAVYTSPVLPSKYLIVMSDLPLNTPDRHIITSQLMEILKLRLGAVIGRKNIDILIVTPNQVWTENILDRPYYKDRGHRLGYPEFRSSLLVQKIGTPMVDIYI